MTDMDRRRVLRLTSAATVAGGLAAGAGGPAHAAARADRRIVLTGRRTGANIPDVLTAGVPYFVRYDLIDAQGDSVGTENAHCLPVAVQRPLPAVTESPVNPQPWSHVFAITGGTEAYAGAAGSITIDHRTRDEDVLTIDLTDASP
ncbi:hypothetical protein ABT285_35800 [Streptomyces microflavus]|uniref:hypothetical protein n=1 Tax=Streptomyces microflavus TaxID=1919 RepID=UPI003330D76E